jgi:hypothetical protein
MLGRRVDDRRGDIGRAGLALVVLIRFAGAAVVGRRENAVAVDHRVTAGSGEAEIVVGGLGGDAGDVGAVTHRVARKI